MHLSKASTRQGHGIAVKISPVIQQNNSKHFYMRFLEVAAETVNIFVFTFISISNS